MDITHFLLQTLHCETFFDTNQNKGMFLFIYELLIIDLSELINIFLIRLNYKLILFSGCVDNHNINTTVWLGTCDCGLWSIPYRACSLQFSFIEQALTSVSAVFWFLLSEIQCRLNFLCENKFYIGRAHRVTDNEV